MPFRLYMDEDTMYGSLVKELRKNGIDVLTAFEARMAGKADPEHLKYSTSVGRVIFTYNIADYRRLHAEYLAQGDTHSGIVVCPQQQYSLGEELRRLVNLVTARSLEEMENNLEFLNSW